MAKKLLDKTLLAVGRWLGVAKRKERTVVERWEELCRANGINLSDRILQLIAWDLQQGGVDLTEIKQNEEQKKAGEIAQNIDLANMVKEIVTSMTAETIQRERQHLEELKAIYDAERKKLLMQLSQVGVNYGKAQGKGNIAEGKGENKGKAQFGR